MEKNALGVIGIWVVKGDLLDPRMLNSHTDVTGQRIAVWRGIASHLEERVEAVKAAVKRSKHTILQSYVAQSISSVGPMPGDLSWQI